jgi:hypothetical protein
MGQRVGKGRAIAVVLRGSQARADLHQQKNSSFSLATPTWGEQLRADRGLTSGSFSLCRSRWCMNTDGST